jgi:catechol-2,3-dioxygenase
VVIRMSRHEGPTRTSAPPKLSATLRLGTVHLTVTDLDRSVSFYENASA